MKAILQAVFDFLLALIEALLKCFLAFSIMFVAVYPLIAVGQGKEAMLAMFDLRPGNMSWLFTGLTLSWACLLTFAFLHFLLGALNYRARNGARSFCRIWLPGVFALCLALLYPISAEMRPGGSLLLDAMFDLTKFDPIPASEVPTPHQFLRSPISTGSCQLAKIFGTIDIPRNPRQFEHNTRQARCLRRSEVRQEAVVPEAKREEVTRRSPRCIRAAPGCVRHQHRSSWRSAIHDLLQF